MKAYSRIILLALSIIYASVTMAGERILQSFQPGRVESAEVLRHVPVKGLVTEFLNTERTDLGKSIGFLLWREALTAVQDQSGAGVIYAHTPDNTRITDMLGKDYHRAAVEIAKSQNTRMALWGQVNEIKDSIYLNSYLTLLPEIIGDELSLNVKIEGMDESQFGAEITRSRYNFKLVKSNRKTLFKRRVVTRAETPVHASPKSDAQIIGNLPKQQALQAMDMHNNWFKIVLPDEQTGWVKLGALDVPPRQVYANRLNVNVRPTPAAGTVLFKQNLNGLYTVLDMRYIPGEGLWYKLKLDSHAGWVAAWLVEPRFSLPVVHFMAGLQRYQLKNYREADKAFQQFIDMTGASESHINLAAANLLLGASKLMRDQRSSAGLKSIQQAVKLTPFDPAVYNLSAVAKLGSSNPIGNKVVKDLKMALQLDQRNTRSVKTLSTLTQMIKSPVLRNTPFVRMLDFQPRTRLEIEQLNKKILTIESSRTLLQGTQPLQFQQIQDRQFIQQPPIQQ